MDLGRSQRALTNLLRAVAAAGRPIVMFIDDLQWAGRSPLEFIERIFSGEVTIPGVLLVGAYRSDQVDAVPPADHHGRALASDGGGPKHLTLSNLSVTELADLSRTCCAWVPPTGP